MIYTSIVTNVYYIVYRDVTIVRASTQLLVVNQAVTVILMDANRETCSRGAVRKQANAMSVMQAIVSR